MKLTKEEARKLIIDSLVTMKEHIADEWPLVEAFTDLDNHPEEDEHGGFNYLVGYVTGLCEAFGFEVLHLCAEVEPEPPESDEPNEED